MELDCIDEARLLASAVQLGECIRPGIVLCLWGAMGAGKTTFARGLAAGMRVDRADRVQSPTYAIAATHEGPLPLVHIDLYRLGEQTTSSHGDADASAHGALVVTPGNRAAASISAGFESLGLEDVDAFPRADAVTLVEWPGYLPSLPEERIDIELRYADDGAARSLRALAHGPASTEVLAIWTRTATRGAAT